MWKYFSFLLMGKNVSCHLGSFHMTEVRRTLSRTHHPWRSVSSISSSNGCCSALTLPRSSSLILVRWKQFKYRYTVNSSPSLTSTLVLAVNAEAMATSGKTDKSPHDQEIKFFAKVWDAK